MVIVEWGDALEIGIESIDQDHKNIIAWINDINEMGDYDFPHKTLVYVLDCLIDYVEHHFRREEQAMEACNYEGTDYHKRAHDKFEEQIRKIHADLMSNSNSVVSADVIKFLVKWLSDHITTLDALMAPYIKDNRTALLAAEHFTFKAIKLPSSKSLR